jgi:NADH-quinone oxidoreductase subunit J
MNLSLIIFFILGLVVIASAVAVISTRNSVYSALFLALNFTTVAFLYLMLGAPFISLVQITVYAGSIMVLFLFVIMLLGAERLPERSNARGIRLVAIILGLVLLVEIGLFVVWRGVGSQAMIKTPTVDFASPAAIGMELFSKYALPMEVVAIILLVAAVGAILLTRSEKTTPTVKGGGQ